MSLFSVQGQFNMIRFEIDDVVVKPKKMKDCYYIKLDRTCRIRVFFEPWKIKPVVRMDHIMLDYYLADIQQFDHMISMDYYHEKFWELYKSMVEQSKMEHFGLTDTSGDEYDFYIGRLEHKELVNELNETTFGKSAKA